MSISLVTCSSGVCSAVIVCCCFFFYAEEIPCWLLPMFLPHCSATSFLFVFLSLRAFLCVCLFDCFGEFFRLRLFCVTWVKKISFWSYSLVRSSSLMVDSESLSVLTAPVDLLAPGGSSAVASVVSVVLVVLEDYFHCVLGCWRNALYRMLLC